MKAIFILLISSILLLGSPSFNSTEKNRQIEAEQVSLWIERLNLAKTKPPMERVGDLALGLRNMGYRKRFEGHSPSVDTIYEDIQKELLSLPGHAHYFAEEIEREQKAVERYPTITGPRVTYDFNRTMHFETLSHLPSPETIAVLGHLLSDDKDTPVPLMSPDSDWGHNPRANSYGSAYSIIDIGLRDPPVSPARRSEVDPDFCLATTRKWWEEIQSGKRAFSFLGQKVEYRFKTDGTWDTIALTNAPDDAPNAVKSPPSTPTPTAAPAKAIQPQGIPWGWITTILLVLLAGMAWLGLRRSQHGT